MIELHYTQTQETFSFYFLRVDMGDKKSLSLSRSLSPFFNLKGASSNPMKATAIIRLAFSQDMANRQSWEMAWVRMGWYDESTIIGQMPFWNCLLLCQIFCFI